MAVRDPRDHPANSPTGAAPDSSWSAPSGVPQGGGSGPGRGVGVGQSVVDFGFGVLGVIKSIVDELTLGFADPFTTAALQGLDALSESAGMLPQTPQGIQQGFSQGLERVQNRVQDFSTGLRSPTATAGAILGLIGGGGMRGAAIGALGGAASEANAIGARRDRQARRARGQNVSEDERSWGQGVGETIHRGLPGIGAQKLKSYWDERGARKQREQETARNSFRPSFGT